MGLIKITMPAFKLCNSLLFVHDGTSLGLLDASASLEPTPDKLVGPSVRSMSVTHTLRYSLCCCFWNLTERS